MEVFAILDLKAKLLQSIRKSNRAEICPAYSEEYGFGF
jgi:hypothetical protein